jgi:hypothetical protein
MGIVAKTLNVSLSGIKAEMVSIFPLPCLPGTYKATTGTGDCTQCPAGYPCPYYGSTTYELGLYCAPGYYCPVGSRFPNEFPCPAGTYSDSITITSASQCTQCPQKFACYAGTNTLTKPRVPCAAGYYCPAGTQYPTQHPCPAGTYSPSTDNYASSQCIVCPPGMYCLQASATPSGQCSPGYYCPQGSSSPS